jgi:V/A-type H+-transporting ATPase subunit E
MPETIESFVSKLQQDGIQAGQQEAEKIRNQAQAQADEILAKAREQAEKITSDAEKEAASKLERSRTEIQLAARDTILTLRDTLSNAIAAVIQQGTNEALSDVDFLGKILHDIVTNYAKSDLEGTDRIEIRVKPELRDQLVDWALREIGRDKVEETRKHIGIDLKGTLSQAGFEYSCAGATVEVTLDSVVEILKQMVSPKLREVVDQAVQEGQG